MIDNKSNPAFATLYQCVCSTKTNVQATSRKGGGATVFANFANSIYGKAGKISI